MDENKEKKIKYKNPFVDESAFEGDEGPKPSEDEVLMNEAKQHTEVQVVETYMALGMVMGLAIGAAFGSLLFGKMGRNKYMSKRKDGATEFRIDKSVVERFKEMEKHQFDGITEDEKQLVVGLFGDKDPIVHFYPLMAKLYGEERCRWFKGENRLNDKIVDKVLLPLIMEMTEGEN